jgi:Cu(I)/Ag(I) efflux system membrane fusion protein
MWLVRAACAAAALTLVFYIGAWFGAASRHAGAAAATPADDTAAAGGAAQPAVAFWTCSMHPQIKLPGPGKCPICFMDLTPVAAGAAAAEDLPRLELSQRARVLAQVRTAPVERREVELEVRMVGKVTADETRIRYVSSYVPGRLDRLYVNYTGILVRKGDHLAEIFGPELLVAQSEYLLALERAEAGRAGESAESMTALLEASRRKLERWGIPADEVERLARERKPSDRLRIDAPSEGWVLDRQGYEGMYVETGTRLFTLADLRTVWVMLDAYELDLPLLRYGQAVEFQADALPGQSFNGRIAYIDPTLSEATRTVKVRVNVPNERLALRPGLFVRARLSVRLGERGEVIETALAGKWISPMHPEIVKDGPGKCDVCGMDLVPAESLGFASAETPAARPLVIPQTAPLLTGRRAVVYAERNRGIEGPRDRERRGSGGAAGSAEEAAAAAGAPIEYEGREVELGPRAGAYYVLRGGLQEGERVVVQGALMLDSAMQIQARPSMMQPRPATEATTTAASTRTDEEARVAGDAPPAARSTALSNHAAARPVIDGYFALVAALAADDAAASAAAAKALRTAAATTSTEGLPDERVATFRQRLSAVGDALPPAGAATIRALRDGLPKLTAALEVYLHEFGHDRRQPLVRHFCPMAFDNRGASWLQEDENTRNPYFGAEMLRCGVLRGAIRPDGTEDK